MKPLNDTQWSLIIFFSCIGALASIDIYYGIPAFAISFIFWYGFAKLGTLV